MPGASLSLCSLPVGRGCRLAAPPPRHRPLPGGLPSALCPLPPALLSHSGRGQSAPPLNSMAPGATGCRRTPCSFASTEGSGAARPVGAPSSTPDSTQRQTPRTQCLPSVGQVEAKSSPSASLKTHIRGSCGSAHSAPHLPPSHRTPPHARGQRAAGTVPLRSRLCRDQDTGKAVRLSGLESSVPGEGHGAGCQGAEEGSGQGREWLQGHEETQGGHRPRNPARAQTGLRLVRTGRDVPCATGPRGGQGFLSPTHAPPGTGPRFSTWSRTLWLGARGVAEMDRAVGSSPLGAEGGSGSPVTARRPLAWLEPALFSATLVDGLALR